MSIISKLSLSQKSLIRSIATEILNFDFNEFMRNKQPESTDYDSYIKLYYETEYYIQFGADGADDVIEPFNGFCENCDIPFIRCTFKKCPDCGMPIIPDPIEEEA